jgi:hypothetical protein
MRILIDTQAFIWFVENDKQLLDTLSVEERQSIERGLEDSKKGRITPHSDVKKRLDLCSLSHYSTNLIPLTIRPVSIPSRRAE